jgi:hypothetical protein
MVGLAGFNPRDETGFEGWYESTENSGKPKLMITSRLRARGFSRDETAAANPCEIQGTYAPNTVP